jgi:RNA-directed DNA polymerase
MGKQFKCGSWGHEPWPWGVDYYHANVWSRTRMGGWAVAQSPILLTTITLERLRKRGYQSMLDYYFQVSPQLNEPLYPA